MKSCVPYLFILVLMLSQLNNVAGQEVKFEKYLSWKDIKEKARAEGKYIFLDVVATWCGPCKKMDNEVYVVDKVGDFMNKNFVSVKVQIDKTPKDNEFIKSWYEDAERLAREYLVRSLPSYVFLSPDGELVHRAGGYREANDFLSIAIAALDSSSNTVGMLKQFRAGEMRLEKVKGLALSLFSAGQMDQAAEVARYYKDNYLDKLPVDSLFNNERIDFIEHFPSLLKVGDNSFKVFYLNPSAVDKLKGKGHARSFTDYVIQATYISPKIWKDKVPIIDKPEWEQLYEKVKADLGEDYADRNINKAKMIWYNQRKEWDSVAKYYTARVDKYGLDTTGSMAKMELNNIAYSIFFKHVNDRRMLGKAANWVKQLVLISPQDNKIMDTYASLLYKMGEHEKGMQWQQKALELAIANKDKRSEELYVNKIEKMKKGLSIW